MNWLTSLSFTVLLIYVQYDHVEARRGHHGSGSSAKSPWANPVKAQAFMKCLIQKISASKVFPEQEKEDMEEIVETMMSAFSSMSSSGGSNAAKMQAMNMAFASSMAELVIAEDADDLDSINVKTEALAKALQQCFKSTLGTVNRHFITEIKDLIGMFAKEAAANEDVSDNEVEVEGGDFGGVGEGVQPSITLSMSGEQVPETYPFGGATEATTSLDFDLTGGYPAGAGQAPSGLSASGGITVRLSAPLTSSLSNSKVFKSAFNTRTSNGVAISLSRNLADTLAANFGLDASTSQQLKNAIVSAVSKVRAGSDTNQYAKAISDATANVLEASGQISESDLNQKAPKLVSVFVQGVSSNAPRFGINLSGINVQDDLSNASRGIVAAIQSGSSEQPSFDTGYGPSTSLDMDLTGTGALTTGSSATGKINVRLSAPLTSSLSNSKVFRAAFNARTSNGVAISLSRNLADSIAANFGLDASTSMQLKNAILGAVSKVRAGSDTRNYAEAISNATADVLAANGQISDSNLKQKAPKLVSVFVQGVSANAPRFGIDLSGINVPDDLSNASRGIVVTIQSGPSPAGPDAGYGPDGYTPGSDVFGSGPDDFGQGLDGFGPSPDSGYTSGDILGVNLGAPSSTDRDATGVLAQSLVNALLRSDTFKAIYNRDASQRAVLVLSSSTLPSIASSLGLDAATTAQLKNKITQSLSTVPAGSDEGTYAKILATNIATVLGSSGKVNNGNVNQVGANIASSLIKGSAALAPRLGLRLPNINVDSDVGKVQSYILSGSAGAPSGAGEPSDTSLDVDMTGGYPGGAGPVPTGPSGSGGITVRLSAPLTSSLSNSKVFRAAFNARTSKGVAISLSRNLADTIAANFGLDASTSAKLKNAIASAVSKVRVGADTRDYAQAISNATADVLAASGQISDSDLNQKAPKLVSVFVQGVSSNAPRFGIDLSGINVSDDLSNASRGMVVTIQNGPSPAGPDAGYTPRPDSGYPGLDISNSGIDLSGDYSGGVGLAPGGLSQGPSQPSGLSVNALADSPVGLKSPQAAARVNKMASLVIQSLGPNGLDVNNFFNNLKSSISQLSSSGLSKSDATVEALMEAMVALMQVLKSAKVGTVDTSSTMNTSNSVAVALSAL